MRDLTCMPTSTAHNTQEELVNVPPYINGLNPNLPESAFYFASRNIFSSFASFSAHAQQRLLPPYCNDFLPTENLASKFSLHIWFHTNYRFLAQVEGY